MSEIIWKSVLDQLRATMPRSAFDTWVVDTNFVSSDDTLFLVGCRNAGTRDWLENRVQTTVEHLLSGMLNRSVSVSFVVTGALVDDSGGSELDLPDDEMQVEAVWDSAYDQVVQPERAIAINAYFLRYLRFLGAELAWLYIGFRQAAYSAGGRSGSRTARFTGKVIAAFSGMSKRAFWRRVGSPITWSQLAGLVNLVDEKPLWEENSATPKRLPRKYSVSMTLPLTATDAKSLMRWIASNMAKAGSPIGVLELACKTPVEEIIPVNAARVIGLEPLPVSQIVRELFSDDIPEAELKALAERLQMHLMPPGDLVMISLFFVEHVLPHLGAGPGWMLTVLRDRCWVNPENGETRNRVKVKGGYAEIASWMGLERAMTVYEWLHGKQRPWLPVRGDGETTKKPNPKAGQYLNPALHVYVREIEQSVYDFADGSREFEVLLDEIPAEIMAAIVKDDPSAIYATGTIGFTQLAQDVYATGTIGFTQLAQDVYANGTIGFTQLAQGVYANGTIAFTQLAQELYATGRVFKLLSSFKPALKTLIKTTTENSENLETHLPEIEKPVVVVDKDLKTKPTEIVDTLEPACEDSSSATLQSPEEPEEPSTVDNWDLRTLFRANGVSQKKQKQLLNSGAVGPAFVSWILYGYTPEGKGLTNLVGNAIQSTLDSPETGAGGICDILAGYGPAKLTSLLIDNIRGTALTDRRFLSSVGQLSIPQKQGLLLRLGLNPADIPERIESVPVYERPASPESPFTDPAQIHELLRSRSQDSRNERNHNHAATI